jgi:hypothetical protein
MKKKIIFLSMLLTGFSYSQTLNAVTFNNAFSTVLSVNIANNASYNASLSTTLGNGVNWDATGLTQASSTPTVHLQFDPPSSTAHAALYPSSNYALWDPALTAFVGVEYYNYSVDSFVFVGDYSPSTAHEIFQNPDKRLIFPFAYGQNFVDTYAKTNYSDATTISSYQNGSRTVTFAGYGNLMLPQGTFSNVALITEVRTNNLGPDSYEYTWYDLSSGKKLLYRSENDGTIVTAWCIDNVAKVDALASAATINIYPNPVTSGEKINLEYNSQNGDVVELLNANGQSVSSLEIIENKCTLSTSNFQPGIYFVKIYNTLNQPIVKQLIIK